MRGHTKKERQQVSELYKEVFNAGELYARVARLLRDARETMNNAGEHWTTGTLSDESYSDPITAGEEALKVERFCAIGGLNKAAGIPQIYVDGYRDPYSHELQTYIGGIEDDDREKYAVIDVAKKMLADVIMGKTPKVETDPTKVWEGVYDAEQNIISFNDGHARELRENVGDHFFYIDLPNEAAWARVAARFQKAEGFAAQFALDAGMTYNDIYPIEPLSSEDDPALD